MEDFAWVHLTQMYSISEDDDECPIGSISYHNYSNLKTFVPLINMKRKKDMKVVFKRATDVYGNENGNGGALFHQERKKAKTKDTPLHPADAKMKIELSPIYITKTMRMLEHYTKSETVKTLLNPVYSNAAEIKKIMEYVQATTMYVRMLYRAFKPSGTAEGLYFPTVHQMGVLAFSKTKTMLSNEQSNTSFPLFPTNVTVSLPNATEALSSAKIAYKEYIEERKKTRNETEEKTADNGSSDSSSDDDEESDSSDDE